jgi:hypothetical protein
MRLPDHARADLLEFIGGTPIAEAHLSDVIDSFANRMTPERRTVLFEAN